MLIEHLSPSAEEGEYEVSGPYCTEQHEKFAKVFPPSLESLHMMGCTFWNLPALSKFLASPNSFSFRRIRLDFRTASPIYSIYAPDENLAELMKDRGIIFAAGADDGYCERCPRD